MKTNNKGPVSPRRTRVVLAAAAVAVSAAVAWSGTSAVATAMNVAASTPAGVPRAPEGPGTAAAPAAKADSPAAQAAQGTTAHHIQAPDAPGSRSPQAPPPQAMPPEPADPRSVGNAPEVSLEAAGRAEVGEAARARAGTNRAGNLPKASPVTPGDVLGAAPNPGGCLREYGEDGQCLPAVPPSQNRHVQEMKDAGLDPAAMPHAWSCGEVRTYFKDGLSVRQPGVDPQRLDANRDGTACGPGD